MSYLEMVNITKTFGDLVANNDISFDVKAGEIHALLGENGAGKSTLMNILYGLYQPDEGDIFLNNEKVTIESPLDAIHLGIGMVHQHFMLIPALTALENVIIGLPSSREPFLDLVSAEKRLMELAERHDLQIMPRAKVSQLSMGAQQRIEILKSLYRGAELLILDEPTAVLTPQETTELFRTLRSLADDGKAVIFISHKLKEVMEISDRITVLRQGEVVGTVKTIETSSTELARLMVGREVMFSLEKPEGSIGQEVLRVEDVYALNNFNAMALNGISFSVRSGEIVGIAGVDGNGQSELAEVVTGLRKVVQGKVQVNDENMTDLSPRRFIEQNVAYIPEDRQEVGSIKGFSLAENAVLKNHDKPPFSNRRILQYPAIYKYTEELVEEYDIRTQSIHLSAHLLSGGNLQKLILARELSGNPELLVAMHPTRGLDVGAVEFIHSRLLKAKSQGAAILLISTELEEIMSLADRIIVLYEGEIMGSFPVDRYGLEDIGLMMAGARRMGGSSCESGEDHPKTG